MHRKGVNPWGLNLNEDLESLPMKPITRQNPIKVLEYFKKIKNIIKDVLELQFQKKKIQTDEYRQQYRDLKRKVNYFSLDKKTITISGY